MIKFMNGLNYQKSIYHYVTRNKFRDNRNMNYYSHYLKNLRFNIIKTFKNMINSIKFGILNCNKSSIF